MPDGAEKFHYHVYKDGWYPVEAEVIAEGSLTLFVNGQELATIQCTPRDPEQLALGFLVNEGFIERLDQVAILYICPSGGCADIWLAQAAWDRPRRKVITSGCTGGVTFADLTAHLPVIRNDLRLSPTSLSALIAQLQGKDGLYARARGVHTSALSDGKDLLFTTEDIGRHNTLDRLAGECLRRGLDPAGKVLLTTGRVSSEMIYKAAKMGCPVVVSRTSPTSQSVEMARKWNITLCGYARRDRLNVYAHPEYLVEEQILLETGASPGVRSHGLQP